jgi:RNA polymerase sigma factor (sigma-70 family)
VESVEAALIARAKAGDRDAYERLLEPAVRPATRLAFAMLHDRQEAEDAFQESALRAWRRLENLREGKRFQPWFIGVVANQCRQVRRDRWWSLLRIPDAVEPAASDQVDAWMEGEDLRRAIGRLPYDQRVTILLHFHLDMPISDVAGALGISASGVKTRINRALKRLRPALGASEVRVNG